jgi:hypothetical protein
MSAMHESAVTALSLSFFDAINRLKVHIPSIWDYLTPHTGGRIPYKDRSGHHIPDFSIRANRDDVFRVEVAVSQTFPNVRQKIVAMLKDESLLGVLLVNIKEKPQWSNPGRKPTTDDLVSKDNWFASMEQHGSFGCVKQNGIDWVKDIEVHVLLFEKGWAGQSDPEKVRFVLISMSIADFFIHISSRYQNKARLVSQILMRV